MTAFIRKNIIKIATQFLPHAGIVGLPSSAEAIVTYQNTSGATSQDTLPMTLDTDGVTWVAFWDSSLTKGGVVQWMAHCKGGLVGSDEGSFTITANSSNTN